MKASRTPWLAIGLLAWAGCASPPQPSPEDAYRDPALVQQDSSARAAFADGQYERAARFYELTLARARAADLGVEIAKAAYNRGACLLLLNQPGPAVELLREAASEFERQRMDPSPAWLLQSRALWKLNDSGAALQEIEKVMARSNDEAVLAQAWMIKGGLSVEAGELRDAHRAMKQIRRLMSDDPALRAGHAALAGRIARAEKRPDDAALQFDKEAAFLQRAARWGEMAESLQRAGESYAAADQPGPAALRYYRSARSLFGQGQAVPALRAVELAVTQAEKADDAALAADVSRLVAEIRAVVGVAQSAPRVE